MAVFVENIVFVELLQPFTITSQQNHHLRTLLVKNTNHQQMHKESYIMNCNTLLHVSTLLDHLQGEFLLSLH
jgi:hypothetical protein